MRILSFTLVAAAVFACVACGLKGPPLPPESQASDVSTSPPKSRGQ